MKSILTERISRHKYYTYTNIDKLFNHWTCKYVLYFIKNSILYGNNSKGAA